MCACFEIFRKTRAHRWENATFTGNIVPSASDLKKGKIKDATQNSPHYPSPFFSPHFSRENQSGRGGEYKQSGDEVAVLFFSKTRAGIPPYILPLSFVLPVSCTDCRYGVIAATSQPSSSPHPFPLTVNLSYYGAAPPPYLHGIDRSF